MVILHRKRGKRLKNSSKKRLGRLSNSLINSRKKETLNSRRLIENCKGGKAIKGS